MSYQCPCTKEIRIYDSMKSAKHYEDVQKQLKFFYHVKQFTIIYCDPKSQQNTSYPCGVYAAAFATICSQHELPDDIELAEEAELRYELTYYSVFDDMNHSRIKIFER